MGIGYELLLLMLQVVKENHMSLLFDIQIATLLLLSVYVAKGKFDEDLFPVVQVGLVPTMAT